MSAISLELIEILDAIDRRGTFAAAAEELNRVPSALSYTIQKYEEQLQLRLFVRQGRRAAFTPEGALMLARGRELLHSANLVVDEVQTLAMGWEPRIRIAVDSLLSMDGVMSVLAIFLQKHPGIELDICEEVLGGAWEAIIQDRVQLVIGAPAPKPVGTGVQTELLGPVERVFAVAAGHPLAQAKKPLTMEEIGQYRLVVVHDSSRSALPRTTRLMNQDKHFYVQTINQKVSAQRAGIGVGFVPKRAVKTYLETGEMVALAVENVSMEDSLYLAWKSANRGPGLKALVKLISQEGLFL